METLRFLKDTGLYWYRNQAARLSAALTYYSLVSLTSMMILILAIVGLFVNPSRAEALLSGPVEQALGVENAIVIQRVLENAYHSEVNLTAGLLSALIIIVSGSELFRQLGFTLNSFWKTPNDSKDLPIAKKIIMVVGGHILYRLRAFVLVLGAGVLMLGTVLVSTLVNLGERFLSDNLSISFAAYGWVNRGFSILAATVLFALIYRLIPKFTLPWKPIWAGAFVAALLNTLLQHLMSLYLSNATLGSAFGAAGSLVVFLFWVYYSIQAMFFGAAWTYTLNQNIELKLANQQN